MNTVARPEIPQDALQEIYAQALTDKGPVAAAMLAVDVSMVGTLASEGIDIAQMLNRRADELEKLLVKPHQAAIIAHYVKCLRNCASDITGGYRPLSEYLPELEQ